MHVACVSITIQVLHQGYDFWALLVFPTRPCGPHEEMRGPFDSSGFPAPDVKRSSWWPFERIHLTNY